jgi:hypothetical protein
MYPHTQTNYINFYNVSIDPKDHTPKEYYELLIADAIEKMVIEQLKINKLKSLFINGFMVHCLITEPYDKEERLINKKKIESLFLSLPDNLKADYERYHL